MQVGKICLNKGFLEVLKPENKQKKSTVSVQSVENADNLTRQEEQKEAALERIRAMKETDPDFYWSVVRLRADQGLKT